MEDQASKTNEAKTETLKNEERIYYSRAKQHRISNFVKEIRGNDGYIVQREGPVRFYENSRITNDPAEIVYIESSEGFKNGDITRCYTMEELQALRAGGRAIRKNMRNFSDQTVERVVIE